MASPDGASIQPMPASERKTRILAFAVIAGFVVLLVGFHRRPPILDLPLMFEQASALESALAGQRSDLWIDWVGPNKFGVGVILLARLAASAAWEPRLAVMLIAVIWLGSMHMLAARARRPIATAILVSPFLFGAGFYVGLFNFLSGAVALFFWTRELDASRRARPWPAIIASTVAGALLLYLTHVIWLQVGGFAIATYVLLWRFRLEETLARAAGALPVILLTLFWSGGWAPADWQPTWSMEVSPLERMTSLEVASSFALGGISHAIEPTLLVTALVWAALGIVRAVREKGRGTEPFLTVMALCLLIVCVFGPNQVDKIVLFSSRWGGFACACLLIGLPQPKVDGRLLAVLASALAASHLLVTAVVWSEYERRYLPGFEESITAVPEGARLFSVDFVRAHPPLRVSPTLHLYAWAAVERGARVESTFADTGNSVLRWVDPASRRPLSEFFLWSPAFLRPVDLEAFTHVLVHGETKATSPWVHGMGVFRKEVDSGHRSAVWRTLEIDRERDMTRDPGFEEQP